MIASSREKYVARVAELEALSHELEAGKRPGDGAVVVGLLLEAAGDVLRRSTTLGVNAAAVTKPLQSIPELSLRSWADGVAVAEMSMKLKRAASQAVEAAIPDSPEAGEAMTRFAVQDLQSRDRLESALVALEALGAAGRNDAKNLAVRLRNSIDGVDRECRFTVVSLTALNGPRRAEASLLDAAYRQQAWWYSDRTGIEDDELVRVLGGEAKGSVPTELKTANTTVTRKRSRPVNADDLLLFNLGLASPAEKEAIRLQADADPELKLALAAMAAGEAAIEELSREEEGSAPRVVPVITTVERSAPEIIEERSEFKVLLFRSKKSVQVVVQPHRQDRFAAAAVFRSDAPDQAMPSNPGDMGLHFDLGSPERLAGSSARVVVKLTDGQTHAFEVRL